MLRTVLVLGGGSAGFLAALTIKKRLPAVDVVVLRSSELGIIGVGEGATPIVPQHLHGYLDLDLAEFYRTAQPTWKLGIRFLWGPRPYFNYTFATQFDSQYLALAHPTGYYADAGGDDSPDGCLAAALMSLGRVFARQENGAPAIGLDAVYHLENETFVAFLAAAAVERGVRLEEGLVDQALAGEQGVTGLRLRSGETLAADFFVDCSGFRSVLLGQALGEPLIDFSSSLWCDRAVVGGWPRQDEPILPYTIAETMDAGWCWQIEHERRINRGYVYSSAFLSDADAEAEFRGKNPRVGPTRIVPFVSGRRQRAWVGNVCGIGNAAGFVEPLEATAIGEICASSQALAETLAEAADRGDGLPGPALVACYNRRTAASWDAIRRFLAIHYRYNTRLDTPFWRASRHDVDLAGAEAIVDFYQENGPTPLWRKALLDAYDQFNLDGWWTLLVGQRVPCRALPTMTDADLANWRRVQAAHRRQAEQGLTSEVALALVRSPAWSWRQEFYR